jgi:hypothetical protein
MLVIQYCASPKVSFVIDSLHCDNSGSFKHLAKHLDVDVGHRIARAVVARIKSCFANATVSVCCDFDKRE